MKKKTKKITKKKILPAIAAGIFLCLFVIGEGRIRYFYFEELVHGLYGMMGKSDYGYTICVYTDQKLKISNGKKERILKPLEYYDGMDNCIWEYARESMSDYYHIYVMEGDELSVTGMEEETFHLSCQSNKFPKGYTVYDSVAVRIYETRDFRFRVEKDCIRFWSEENLGSEISLNLYPRTWHEKDFHMHHDFGQVIYAVEIRREGDSLPVTHVDLDGDGYCEFDCGEYGEWETYGDLSKYY